jgi:hypothetical protein
MTRLKYRVHSVAEERVEMSVSVGDRQVVVPVPRILAELVCDDPPICHNLPFAPRSKEEHDRLLQDLRAPGATVTAEFTLSRDEQTEPGFAPAVKPEAE